MKGTVLEAMLFAPHRVGCGRAFVELGVLITEDEPDVELGVLLTDQQVFLSVLDSEPAFGFDIKIAARFWQPEVWCVVRLALRPYKLDTLSLVENLKTAFLNLSCCFIFEA